MSTVEGQEETVTSKTDKECEQAIKTFANITGTDEALAHLLLQDVDFEVERALKRYYSDENLSGDGSAVKQVAVLTGVSSRTAPQPSTESEVNAAGYPHELTLLSWNIDGIDSGNLNTRFSAVLNVIAKANPEVIFLQEMVPELVPKLFDVMEAMYNIFVSDTEAPYFTVTLVSRNIRIEKEQNVPFTNTQMGRSMFVVEAKWHNLDVKLINTHLESMAEYSDARKAQFFDCMQKLGKFASDPNCLAVFAGDLNIRDNEVYGVPASVRDAWVAGGSNTQTQYTWDQQKNDNHAMGGNFKPRKRFDRIYFAGPYKDVDFSLLGTQRIRNTMCFPSDHFAVCARFYHLETKG